MLSRAPLLIALRFSILTFWMGCARCSKWISKRWQLKVGAGSDEICSSSLFKTQFRIERCESQQRPVIYRWNATTIFQETNAFTGSAPWSHRMLIVAACANRSRAAEAKSMAFKVSKCAIEKPVSGLAHNLPQIWSPATRFLPERKQGPGRTKWSGFLARVGVQDSRKWRRKRGALGVLRREDARR